MLLELGKFHFQALKVGFDLLTEDNDYLENGLHYPMEVYRGSSKTEWHPVVLKQSKQGGKRCFVSIGRINFYLIVGRGQVNGGDVLWSSQDIQTLIYLWQRVSITFDFRVQLTVVNIRAQCAIFLLDQYNW